MQRLGAICSVKIKSIPLRSYRKFVRTRFWPLYGRLSNSGTLDTSSLYQLFGFPVQSDQFNSELLNNCNSTNSEFQTVENWEFDQLRIHQLRISDRREFTNSDRRELEELPKPLNRSNMAFSRRHRLNHTGYILKMDFWPICGRLNGIFSVLFTCRF